MLVVILLLLGFFFLAIGLVSASKTGWKGLGVAHLGWGLLVLLLIVGSIVHYSSLFRAIGLEPVYDTALVYTSETPQDVLVISISSITEQNLSKSSWDLRIYQQELQSYNNSLYLLRSLSRDVFLWPLIQEPRQSLKPIVLR